MKEELCREFAEAFHGTPVQVVHGDIFSLKADAIVSPANSFGIMDGGIDLLYAIRFGWDVERKLRDNISKSFYGEVPVGCADWAQTADENFPILIAAPTMRIPCDIQNTVNVFLAFRAALFLAKRSFQFGSIVCPGMGTGVGRMPYARAARQMRMAYDWVNDGPCPVNNLKAHHNSMLE